MGKNIITKYFEVVPVFRYKEIELKERLTLIFYVIGFILSIVAFITSFLIGMSFLINIPNLVILLLCLFLPFIFPNNFSDFAKTIVYLVAFIYLPVIYFTNGGHNGIGTLYFLMMIVYFAFYLNGKKLVFTLLTLMSFYTLLIVTGYTYPNLVIPYSNDFSRLIDIIISLLSSSAALSMIAISVFNSYRIEKDHVYSLMEELAESNRKLQVLSNTDQLTEVFNRRYFIEKLTSEFEYYEKSNVNFYVMMLDLDDFKIINDTHGHLYGDEILRKVAKSITACLREYDLVSRYGGEEFSIIISHSNKESGIDIAERIRTNIESIVLRNKNNITVSIGVAKSTKKDTVLGIIQRADEYLYIAKDKGKNMVEGQE